MLLQYCNESGTFPESWKSLNCKLISLFSLAFQHDAPTNLQINPTEVLEKLHELSLFPGSFRLDFTPFKHFTSSCLVEELGDMITMIRSKMGRSKD